MNWEKVVAKLRWFGENANESAKAAMMEYGRHADAVRYQERANACYTLAAVLEAGLKD